MGLLGNEAIVAQMMASLIPCRENHVEPWGYSVAPVQSWQSHIVSIVVSPGMFPWNEFIGHTYQGILQYISIEFNVFSREFIDKMAVFHWFSDSSSDKNVNCK